LIRENFVKEYTGYRHSAGLYVFKMDDLLLNKNRPTTTLDKGKFTKGFPSLQELNIAVE
jgi:hypothetical protein